ncbi:AbiTii domain-containing protein [Hymenobacter ruricola]|uniref:AbiTii domain-containing protein n=1 Tax=Hymenobacter ruricola TaxID=2791023 RepID=A0ABS0I495_9BACT|nr:hypothetical protein [Hymenobacter ruricola]MBF9221761.1 hypothetical protein [Hymenobacter ruricola]
MKASELINAAIDELHGTAALSTALLKVKTIAFLIKNQQLKEWVNFELKGYDDGSEVPSYRKTYIPVYATLLHVNFSYNGARQNDVLVPMEYLTEEERANVGERNLSMSITEIEEWALSEQGGLHELSNAQRSFLNHKLYRSKRSEWILYKAWQPLSAPFFKGVLFTVRATLLDLLLELSEWDDVSLQSLQQKQLIDDTVSKALHSITVTAGGIVNVSHGDGSVQAANTGDAAQFNVASGEAISQSIASGQVASLPELVEQIKQAFQQDPAFDSHREEIDHQVQSIDLQLQKPEPKKSILKRAFDSLQELAADSAGATAGHAVFELLKQAPTLLATGGLG